MLDINLFRTEQGGDPEKVRESQRRRFKDPALVDKVIELDQAWRQERFKLDQANKEFNALNKEIGNLRKAKQDTTALQEQSKTLKAALQAQEKAEAAAAAARDAAIVPIGNLVHDSVPVHNDEAHNAILKTWNGPNGDLKLDKATHTPFKLLSHYDIVQLTQMALLTEGQAVAGSRGYYLNGAGVFLNQALINYALGFLHKRGYAATMTPFMMRQSMMGKVAQLADFGEQLYSVTGEGEDKYLIATSEQTLCGAMEGRWFEKGELPVKLAGFSTCFRKEAGSHGRDTLGIFRVHQFEKVEQFVAASCDEDASWEIMEELLANCEEFYQSLNIPYRVVNIVSGELNDAAAKKYDLEAWFPGGGEYRELVSCSNCTDYQSRRLDVRLRTPKGPGGKTEKKYVHLLNSTLTATERTMCCIMENYQTADGVRVPEVLLPYTHGIDFIPYVKMLDKKGNLVDKPTT